MKDRRLTFTALIAAVTLTAAACGGAGDTAGAVGEDLSPTTGFDGSTIKLGVLTGLSGPAAVIGVPITSGNKVWFDHLNEQGGIAGEFRVELVEADMQYRPDLAVQQYNRIKGDVTAFVQLFGTPSTFAVLEQLQGDNIIAGPASLDAFWVREENLLPLGATYQIEAINAVSHYISDGGGSTDSTICTMTQDDVYGEAGQEGVKFAAEHYGFDIANTQTFRLGTESYAGQVGALARAGCEMVFLTATPEDSGKIWGTAAQAGYTPQWYAQSPAYIGALAESPVAPYLAEHVLVASQGTEWGDESVPGMADMIERVDKFAPDQEPDYYFSFGYNQGRAFTALLEKAVELGDLSREGLLEASNQLGTVSFDGLMGDYTYGPAEDRNPPRETTIFEVDTDKPFGLGVVQRDVVSEAAEAFEFEKR